jgi:hypothetical protein
MTVSKKYVVMTNTGAAAVVLLTKTSAARLE